MTFSEFASDMYQFWLLGLLVVYIVVASGNKRLLRVNGKKVGKWIRLMFVMTFWRIIIYSLLQYGGYFVNAFKTAPLIPWQVSMTVFWEDLVFVLPLYVLKKKIGNNKWLKPIYWVCLLITMLTFSSMHMYQGSLAALFIGLYIPFTMKYAEKYGFGTTMICHMLYDLSTMLFVKFMHGG